MPDLRSEFAAATLAAFARPFADGYTIEPAPDADWPALLDDFRARVFSRSRMVAAGADVPENDRHRWDEIGRQRADTLTHHLVFRHDGRIVGTYWGAHRDAADYHMISTLLDPDHQNRGVYTAFLAVLVPMLEGFGFRSVFSRHHADNAAALIPKLKAGFVISGFEISLQFGLLVHLRRWTMPADRLLHGYRVDAPPFDAALRARGLVRRRPGHDE